MNSKLHVVSDAAGRRICMYLNAGRTSDYIGAAILSTQPKAGALFADRLYESDWFRNVLIANNI